MTLETKATLLLDNQIYYKQTVSTYFIKYKCKNLGKKNIKCTAKLDI